ncbi:MAG: hypothetical protein KGQ48_17190, partial [Bradyrhizobium sp.]|nr:hypothetical protein [Bradyrhizobium sp.]
SWRDIFSMVSINLDSHRRSPFADRQSPEPFPFRWNRNGAPDSRFDAFSLREPVSTSLENALTCRAIGCFPLANRLDVNSGARNQWCRPECGWNSVWRILR